MWPQLCIIEREGEDRAGGSGPLARTSHSVLSALHATCSGNSHFSFWVTPEGAARFQTILLLWPAHISPEGYHLGQARLTGF